MPVSIRKNHYVPRILPKRAKRLASWDLSAVGKQNCHKVICHARFECHHPWRPVDVVANNPFACGSFDIFGLFWRRWQQQQQQPSTTSALPSHFEDRPIEDVLALCADERIFTVLLRLQTHIFSLTRRLLLCISVTHVRGKNTYLLSLLKFYFIL